MSCGALRVSAVFILVVLAAVGACAQRCYEYTPTSCWFGLQSGRHIGTPPDTCTLDL